MNTATLLRQKDKIDGRKLRELADAIKKELPESYGFALIIIETDRKEKLANYISNIHDDFMINALESHLSVLKAKKAFSAI